MPRNITKLKDALKYIKNNKSIMTVDEMEKMNEIKYSNENKKASSKEEKLYNKILSNPNISDIDKKHLKRNTKEGTKLDMDDLKAFKKNALMMNEDWSDEEKPKKKSKGNKKVIDYDDENIDDLERVIGILNKKILKTHDVKYNNDLMNKRDELMEKVKEIKARPEVKRLIKELDIALKKGDKYEITTDMNVRKGLGPKAKKALKESVNKALDNEFKGGRINGGMIGNDDDSDYEYAPLPLVTNQHRQDRIDDVLGNLYDNENINIIDMMDNKNLNDLSKEDVIKRNNYLKEVIDDIEPGNSVNMVKIKTWNELLPIEKSRYYNDARNLGIRPKEKYLNDAYEKAKKQLSKKNNKIKKFFNVLEGTGIKRINLDYSSDEEPIKRKRGRPKKGKGYGSFKSISMKS